MSCAHETVVRGDHHAFRVTVYDAEVGDIDDLAARFDLTGWTIYLRVKKSPLDATVLIDKDSTDVTEIEILTQTGLTVGQFDVFLVPSDTETLEPGTYEGELKALTDDLEVKSIGFLSLLVVREIVDL